MNYEKLEGRRKGSNIFCCDGYMYSKSNEYENKISLRCVFYKKDRFGIAYIEIEKFFNTEKHNHAKKLRKSEKQKMKQE